MIQVLSFIAFLSVAVYAQAESYFKRMKRIEDNKFSGDIIEQEEEIVKDYYLNVRISPGKTKMIVVYNKTASEAIQYASLKYGVDFSSIEIN